MVDFVSKVPIDKGWSGDRKYCAVDKNDERFLLRISPAEQYEAKKLEFDMMSKLAQLGVPMCEPLEFGVCDDGVYSVQTWIDGTDAEEYIPKLAENEQYEYGLEAGRILKDIHSLPAPDDVEDWAVFFNRKIDRKIENYRKCPLKYENGQAFIDFIEEHRHLLEGRKRTYQHGDYHIGNMMVDKNKKLYIIDFNRNDFGDPWEEFNRIVWCAQACPVFASGMVDGYFGGDIPQEFWELLELYISVNCLSSLPWAIPFGDEQVEIMIRQADEVLGWYDGMKRIVPRWYAGKQQRMNILCL